MTTTRIDERIDRPVTADRPTVDELYARFYQRVLRYAQKILQDRYLAQDVAQETFLKAHVSLHTLRNGHSLESWLFAIARNETRNVLRKSRGRGGVDPEDVPSDTTPIDEIVWAETTRIVRETIDAMKPEYREVLVLREYELMTYAEIATIIGESEGVVKMRLLRARRALIRKMRPYIEREGNHDV